MRSWIGDLLDRLETHDRVCLVTVVAVRGSAPREPGARMVVSESDVTGSIGGGQLEYQCTRIATEMLRAAKPRPAQRNFPLGARCGQCCGGVVEITFELVANDAWLDELRDGFNSRRPFVLLSDGDGNRRLLPDDGLGPDCSWNADTREFRQRLGAPGQPIAVFGAGHVGSAIVAALAPLDFAIHWIDNRRSLLPDAVPDNVTTVETGAPALEVAAMPAGACYLVMTHSHSLDFEITDAVLRRGDAAYCGLIGSLAKRRRFERLMRDQGLGESRLRTLVCPIGIGGIVGKRPQEIAIAVAAQLLALNTVARESVGDNNVHVL